MFNKYPYINLTDLNLGWILEQIKKVTSAAGVTFDDTATELNADNVQSALEALKTLIDNVALQSTNVILLDDTIPATYWENGHVYTHLQTVNIPVLMSIINAVREGKIIVLKQTDNAGTITDRYLYLFNVEDDPNNLVHHVLLYDVNDNTVYRLNINGLNDDANVYVDIDTKVVIPYVNTFNGREGNVVSQAGDYAATEIDYDNANSGLAATNTQAAIDEIAGAIPAVYVESFNGRDGAVNPENGDYSGVQISFNNSYSGLAATNVQDAIDEISDDILSAGVASFNGRTGAVNPSSGDYDASMIAIDTSNTNLPASVNTVQKYINYEHPAVATITLTLNGAMEDTIAVVDSNNVTIGTCVFASGQTSGTITTTVASGYSDTWTFTSSVSKDTTNIANDYVKTATVTDASTQTINVYPDGVVYWYGNKLGNVLTNNPGNCTMSFTEATNSFTYALVTDAVGYDPYIGIAKNLTGLTSCGAIYSASKATNSQARVFLELSGVTTQVLVCYDGTDPDTIPTKVKTNTFTSRDCDHIRLTLTPYFNGTNAITVYALWLE